MSYRGNLRNGNGNRRGRSNGDGHHSATNGRNQLLRATRCASITRRKPVLITGGAGFVGTNVAAALLADDHRVLILDNLLRPGVEQNLQWLFDEFGAAVDVDVADVRNVKAIDRAVACAAQVYHFAAQVAVTTSLVDPVSDFDVNAQGTVNLLEALRRRVDPPPLLFTSTNKVYGNLPHLRLEATSTRYHPADETIGRYGIAEDQPLDFHSPYGCSKGTADQYVLDYARCYHLPTVVFRMSCIYGPHQCGNEDQGWVAHFLLRTLRDEPLTIYGDGKQVRDVLHVDDLVRAMRAALQAVDRTRGRAFNIGGGPQNTCSLRELVDLLQEIHGTPPRISFAPWRQGDQRYYVSDTRQLQRHTGWRPRINVRTGVDQLYQWLAHRELAKQPADVLAAHD